MQRRTMERIVQFSLLTLGLVLLGFGLGRMVYDPDLGQPEPMPLTNTERHDVPFIVQPTEPLVMRLEIMEAGKFKKENPGDAAIAYPHASPCTIVIPSGWMIEAVPEMSFAQWQDDDNGNTLAHEILHCLRGSWHP